MTNDGKAQRIANALWGMFCGDSLAMPAHWFYSVDTLRETFDGGITGFEAPPHPHPESFMVGADYSPDVESANRHARAYDILHENARFYRTTYSEFGFETSEREGAHGNAVAGLDQRYHYHHGLKAGDHTAASGAARALIRSVVEEGKYRPDAFLAAFVGHFTKPGQNRDPYLEIYIRDWFENYARGLPLDGCAQAQRQVWSIGSHGGMIRPMIVAMLAGGAYDGLGFALEHQCLTHRSENVATALGVTVPLLHALLNGEPAGEAVRRIAAGVRAPAINGHGLFRLYREHEGPGNIPADEMWKLHTEYQPQPIDWEELSGAEFDEVVLGRFATACYPEHGLPLLLYFALRNSFEILPALLDNANAGGDNVHRGAVLGLLVGAACDGEFPADLRTGLADESDLAAEINAFAELAASGRALT